MPAAPSEQVVSPLQDDKNVSSIAGDRFADLGAYPSITRNRVPSAARSDVRRRDASKNQRLRLSTRMH